MISSRDHANEERTRVMNEASELWQSVRAAHPKAPMPELVKRFLVEAEKVEDAAVFNLVYGLNDSPTAVEFHEVN